MSKLFLTGNSDTRSLSLTYLFLFFYLLSPFFYSFFLSFCRYGVLKERTWSTTFGLPRSTPSALSKHHRSTSELNRLEIVIWYSCHFFVRTHLHTPTHVHTPTHTNTHTHWHWHICTYTHTNTHTHTHTLTLTLTLTHTHTHWHWHTPTHTHTHTHTH